MNSDEDRNMFTFCRKSSNSKFYIKVEEDIDEEQSQESGKQSNSLEHLPLTRLRSLKENEEVYIFNILKLSVKL